MSNNGIFDSDIWPKAKVEFVRTSRTVFWMPGATHCSFLVIGGGGGGGSGAFSTGASAGGGSGGSGGSLNYCRRFPRFLMQSTQSWEHFEVTIGSGGTGGNSVNTASVGVSGTSGGNSSVAFRLNVREGASQGQNLPSLIANGGGAGSFGSLSTNSTATGTTNGHGSLTGGQGGAGSFTGGGADFFNYSTNAFGTNPFYGSMIGGGSGGNSKNVVSASWNIGWYKFYQSGATTPTLAAGTNGRDASERAANIWNYVEEDYFKEAPYLEDLWWFTSLPGGSRGAGGSTTANGGSGGNGYFGSGGAGGAASGATGFASGAGGTGGTGLVVFWWEKLQ